MFLHAGWLHLGGNMLYLSIFGRGVEDHLGLRSRPIPRVLPWHRLAATAAQAAVAPASTVPMVGASGAIAGVLGAFLLSSRARDRDRGVPDRVLRARRRCRRRSSSLVWFVLQLASAVEGFTRTAAGSGGCRVTAHVGGFVTGILLALLTRWRGRPATDPIRGLETLGVRSESAGALLAVDLGQDGVNDAAATSWRWKYST